MKSKTEKSEKRPMKKIEKRKQFLEKKQCLFSVTTWSKIFDAYTICISPRDAQFSLCNYMYKR